MHNQPEQVASDNLLLWESLLSTKKGLVLQPMTQEELWAVLHRRFIAEPERPKSIAYTVG